MPPDAQPQRAMSQADLFIQQTRAQAAQQLSQPAAAFTGGVGGAQPGIMSYAAGRAGAFAGGFSTSVGQSVSAGMGGIANVPAAAAAFVTPGARQMGDIIEGARYQGGGAPPMSLSGMLATAYAPTSLFPHAGMSFGMERGVRREMAQEELGRRWTQTGRGALHSIAHGATLGLSSYAMRRTGLEASWLTEMETERTLQNRLGVVRGSPFSAVSGKGVARDFFQAGPGRAAMNVIQQRGGELQSQFGYGSEQMNMLTRMSAGAVDVTRIQQAHAGGRGGMAGLGREISDIREQAAGMAREMQMSEKELQEFFGRLKGVMRITGEGLKDFQQENRRLSGQGPFSQKQVAGMRMQFTQMGRQMYLGGADFGTQAMEQANRVSELRRSGVISADTLLREGGGLDPEAMARMVAARIQQQAGLVQGGNFNQSLVLAGQNPDAYAAMMGGASLMQTQAALGATMARNPFALLQAQLDPAAVRRVTMQAPAIAFQKAQQMGGVFVSQNQEQLRAQQIRSFGGQMGYDIRTPKGLGQARVRYEELEVQREMITTELRDRLYSDVEGSVGPTAKPEEIREMASSLMGIMTETGESAAAMGGVMSTIHQDTDLMRRWSTGGAAGKSRLVREVMADERANNLYDEIVTGGPTVGRALKRNLKQGIHRARSWARTLAKKGATNAEVNKAVFGDMSRWKMKESADLLHGIVTDETGRVIGFRTDIYEKFDLEKQKLVEEGDGKFKIQSQAMKISGMKIRDALSKMGDVNIEEFKERIMELSGKGTWVSEADKNLTSDDIDDETRRGWVKQFERAGTRFSVESIRQAGMARNDWARARKQGAGVFDILRRGGLDVDIDVSRGLGQLLDVDIKDKKKFEALRKDRRLEPLIGIIEKFGGEGIRTEKGFKEMHSLIGRENMSKFFKEYAASEEGLRRLGGESFQEFIGDRPIARMNELFQGMKAPEKQAFLVRTLTSAIEKSQRLVNETKYGESAALPIHILINEEQVTALAKK